MSLDNLVFSKLWWTLENVTKTNIYKHRFRNPIQSPVFTLQLGSSITKWVWDIFTHDNFLCIFFRNHEGVDYYEECHYNEILLDLHFIATIGDHEIESEMSAWDLVYTKTSNEYKEWKHHGIKQFMKLDDLFDRSKGFIDEENTLKIAIKLSFRHDFDTEYYDDDDYYEPRDYFYKFYEDRMYSDCTIVCSDGVEIPVHRIILANVSEVLKALFNTDPTESKTNKVTLSDVEGTTMEEVIKFCYGAWPEVSDALRLMKMLYAAKKYEIFRFDTTCINALMKSINAENVLEVFVEADIQGVKCIEVKCLQVIMENYDNLRKSIEEKLIPRLILKITDEFTKILTWNFETSL